MATYEAERECRTRERQVETAQYIFRLRAINEAEAWYRQLPEERKAILSYYFKDNTKDDMFLYIAKDKHGALDIIKKVEADIRSLEALPIPPANPTQATYHRTS